MFWLKININPGFKKLFDKGIRTEYTTVEFPSLSIPNYYTLMTGKMFENGTMIGKMLE
jgi:ectonucleotide pyrophosphatase/phosphodiesterase family protein 6